MVSLDRVFLRLYPAHYMLFPVWCLEQAELQGNLVTIEQQWSFQMPGVLGGPDRKNAFLKTWGFVYCAVDLCRGLL